MNTSPKACMFAAHPLRRWLVSGASVGSTHLVLPQGNGSLPVLAQGERGSWHRVVATLRLMIS